MICFLILDHVIFIILEICFLIQLRQTVHSYTRDRKFERRNSHEYHNRVIINEAKRKQEYFRNSFKQFFFLIIIIFFLQAKLLPRKSKRRPNIKPTRWLLVFSLAKCLICIFNRRFRIILRKINNLPKKKK